MSKNRKWNPTPQYRDDPKTPAGSACVSLVEHVLIAPSERAVVDVHFDKPGPHILEHRTPKRGKHQSRASNRNRLQRTAQGRAIVCRLPRSSVDYRKSYGCDFTDASALNEEGTPTPRALDGKSD
jgi:hypothetical protein